MGSIYPFLRKIGNGPNDAKKRPFHIPAHLDLNLSPLQCAENIAEYFSMISQEYAPINLNNLQPNLQTFLRSHSDEILPVVSQYDIYMKIQKSKKSHSFVKGEVSPKLIRAFNVEFSVPAAIIFNNIVKFQKFPDQWKVEHGVPIPKSSTPPDSLDDLRIISKTHFLSKIFESFIVDWLFPHISPFLDSAQYGGLKGLSTVHYLIQLLDFTHSVLDRKQPHAVIAALIDLSKAFNRVDHNILIEDLYSMKCPSWLLRLIVSYLSKRSLIVNFKGCSASPKLNPLCRK